VIPHRLSVVSVGAVDVPALRAFYEGLGWTTNSPAGGDFAAFPLGGAVFALYSLPLLAAEAGMAPATASNTFKGFTLAINVEEREQVAQAHAAAVAAGARSQAEPEERDWGGVSAYFADPENNAWEIAWAPGATFDERGALIWPF
jgi:catechol 2,3-dioxygenase-like lactoylglutathione lyase family enzyme